MFSIKLFFLKHPFVGTLKSRRRLYTFGHIVDDNGNPIPREPRRVDRPRLAPVQEEVEEERAPEWTAATAPRDVDWEPPPLPTRSPNLFRMGFEPDVLREAIRHSHGYDDRAVIELILKIQPLLDTGAEFGHAFTMLKQFDWDAESALLFMEGRRFL